MGMILEARGVGKLFKLRDGRLRSRSLTAVAQFSIAIEEERPSIVAIAGESGSGKTTLARILLGLYRPSTGKLLYRGEEIGSLDASKLRRFRREVQAIFQDPFEVYNPFYRVDHVLEMPLAKFGLAADRSTVHGRIHEALAHAGLRSEETLGRFPHQLSGGQRQRVMIARALLLEPKIIIADEPVSMVDASFRATILDNLMRLRNELGISILYITHDLTTAYQLCDTIVVLYRGEVVEAGDVDSVIKAPKHPYTQLLVRSIPLPDPDKPWGDVSDSIGPVAQETGREGCLFADRCPMVMETCKSSAPGLKRVGVTHAARCFLYSSEEEVDDPSVVLTRAAGSSGTSGGQAGSMEG